MQLSKLMKDNLEKAEEQELTSSNNLLLQVGNALKSLPADKVAKETGLEGARSLHVVSNPEYAYAVVDSNNVFLFGVKNDGSVEWQKGIPGPVSTQLATLGAAIAAEVTRAQGAEGTNATAISSLQSGKVDKVEGKGLVDSTFANGVSVVSNPEFAYAVVDASGKFLFGVKSDGSFEWQKGIPQNIKDEFSETISEISSALGGKVDKVYGKSLVDSTFANGVSVLSNDEYSYAVVDANGTFLFGVKKDGSFDWQKGIPDFVKNENKANNWSEYKDYNGKYLSVEIPKPRCAIVNFTSIGSMPQTKTSNLKGYIEFWDGEGNYFKKKAVLNAQGQTSMSFEKKNVSFDMYNDDWFGDDSFKLKIGDWVSQDSFHLKAYWRDFFKGIACVAYDLYDEMQPNPVWKMARISNNDGYEKSLCYGQKDLSIRVDTGAKNHPLGFPCKVYLNGEFYGVFAWQLKKHRDNYAMEKKNNSHIHLDGDTNYNTLFGGNIDWTSFEIRNPKSLKNIDGSGYDGDDPKEIQDGPVKQSIVRLSNFIGQISSCLNQYGADSEEYKNLFESYFDVENISDYIVFGDFIYNQDGCNRNWQWVTYDGEKWFVCPYDLDYTFGYFTNNTLLSPYVKAHFSSFGNDPKNVLYYFTKRSEWWTLCKDKWARLRNSGIFSREHIMNLVEKWILSIGFDNFEKEYKKWPGSEVNNDVEVDSHWSLCIENGIPVCGDSITYDSIVEYSAGDECYYGANEYMGFYKFVCISDCRNVSPIKKWMFKDSLSRLDKWLSSRISSMDSLYKFNT